MSVCDFGVEFMGDCNPAPCLVIWEAGPILSYDAL